MGPINVAAVDEYRQTCERYEELTVQRDDLTRAQLDLMGIIDDLMKKMDVQFRAQFALLNENFKETFVNLFGGGRAELQLADPNDALNCGIEVIAQPPGKKLQMLSLLSGGERALTAIAILFAILLPGRNRGRAGRREHRQLRRIPAQLFQKHAVRGHHPPKGHNGALRRALRHRHGGKGRIAHGERQDGRRSVLTQSTIHTR